MAVLREALGATAPWHSVELSGVRLAYNDEGSGPVIVCLHAIGHGAGDFERFRRAFAIDHRVVALDWPGQGHSGNDRVPASAERYAELLGLFLVRLGLENVVLVGNSIGGAAALRYTAGNPQQVRALVLENPGGLDSGGRVARAAIGLMVAFFRAGERRAFWFMPVFRAYYKLVLTEPAAKPQREKVIAAAYEVASILAGAWDSFRQPANDLRSMIPSVRCPVLFAWAVRDRFVSLRRNRPAIDQFSHHRLLEFRAGHAAHLEAPDEFEAGVRDFLQIVSAGAARR
jgi:4,5:9,10-diseco-3-hydroxy-5,9,17-trioxoandrosta-1(10),2-diene-4-oate hydrolase